MNLGPIELLVLNFPQAGTGDVGPALRSLVEGGTIRIVDILFVSKADDGTVTSREIHELADDDGIRAAFDPLVEELAGLLGDSDVQWIGNMLAPGASAGLMLFENTWATRFRDAVVAVGGQVLFNERIPRATVDELLREAAAA